MMKPVRGLMFGIATLAALGMTGCATAPASSTSFIRELAVYDDGFRQGGVPATTITVRASCSRNYDPSATYRLYLDLNQDGEADFRIETRHHDGRWITSGGPKGTVGGDPGSGAEAVYWRVPTKGLAIQGGALRLWVEADTPQGLFRLPERDGRVFLVGRPDAPMGPPP